MFIALVSSFMNLQASRHLGDGEVVEARYIRTEVDISHSIDAVALRLGQSTSAKERNSAHLWKLHSLTPTPAFKVGMPSALIRELSSPPFTANEPASQCCLHSAKEDAMLGS